MDRFDTFFFDLIYERIALRFVSGLWGNSPLIRFRDKDLHHHFQVRGSLRMLYVQRKKIYVIFSHSMERIKPPQFFSRVERMERSVGFQVAFMKSPMLYRLQLSKVFLGPQQDECSKLYQILPKTSRKELSQVLIVTALETYCVPLKIARSISSSQNLDEGLKTAILERSRIL